MAVRLNALGSRLKKLELKNKDITAFPTFTYEAFGVLNDIQVREDPELLVAGPAGTGKSTALLAKIHTLCTNHPQIRVLIVRKSRATLAESVLKTFESNVLGYGHPLLKGASRANRKTYVYPNGSRIVIGGMDNPDRIMSSDYDVVAVFESTELNEQDWDNLSTRLRNNQLPYQQLIADCNPASNQHWIYKRYERKAIAMVESKHEDNPMLFDHKKNTWTEKGVNYLARLDNLSGLRYDRLRLGKWVSAEGQVYDMYDNQRHILSGLMPVFKKFYIGMDVGYTAPGTMVVFGETNVGELILVEELYKTGQTIDWWVAEAKKANAKYKPEKILCDPARPDVVMQMCHAGVPAVRANNKILYGVDLVQRRLKAGTLKFHINSLREVDKELQSNYLPLRLTDEITGYVWGEGDKPVAKLNHALDAMRYVMAYVDRTKSTIKPATSTSIGMYAK